MTLGDPRGEHFAFASGKFEQVHVFDSQLD